MKIDCQLIAPVITPPITGPIVAPATPAAAHRAAPLRSSCEAATRSSRQEAITNAPPIACATRETMRISSVPASAQPADAAANATSPAAPA